eukprot:5134125-Pyramimonas_sp.AAC.1
MTPEERHDFRSLLQKVRWPVARVVPQLAYSVSAPAQKDPKGRRLLRLRVLNDIIDRLQDYDKR